MVCVFFIEFFLKKRYVVSVMKKINILYSLLNRPGILKLQAKILSLAFIPLFVSAGALASCPKAFEPLKVERSDKDVSDLSPEAIRRLSEKEVQELTKKQIQILTIDQVLSIPFQHLKVSQVEFFTSAQVNAIIAKSQGIFDKNLFAFSLFIRLHIEGITPDTIAKIPGSHIRYLSSGEIVKLNKAQIQALIPEHIKALGKTVQFFPPSSLAFFSPEQTNALSSSQLFVLNPAQKKALVHRLKDVSL